jgi:hypothetical protein
MEWEETRVKGLLERPVVQKIMAVWRGRESEWVRYRELRRRLVPREFYEMKLVRYLRKLRALGFLERGVEGRRTYYRPSEEFGAEIVKAYDLTHLRKCPARLIFTDGTVSLYGVSHGELTEEEAGKLDRLMSRLHKLSSEYLLLLIHSFIRKWNLSQEEEERFLNTPVLIVCNAYHPLSEEEWTVRGKALDRYAEQAAQLMKAISPQELIHPAKIAVERFGILLEAMSLRGWLDWLRENPDKFEALR